MPEEVLFETEGQYGRGEVADHLEAVADSLRADGTLVLRAGADEFSVEVPDRLTFEVKAEREGPPEGPGERSVEFELEWPEGSDGADGGLEVG